MTPDLLLDRHPSVRAACASLTLLLICQLALSQGSQETPDQATVSGVRVRHLLGLGDVRKNTKGQLRLQGNTIEFRPKAGAIERVKISSIQDVSLGTEDKQVGGVPMTLGKAAVPFEGGRAISLFSHKKYGTLTVEYLDENGGLHGAVFEMNKQQGEGFEKALIANGAHATTLGTRTIGAPDNKAIEVKP